MGGSAGPHPRLKNPIQVLPSQGILGAQTGFAKKPPSSSRPIGRKTGRPKMSLTNTPDPEIRKAVVKQDLDSVLHPIVQHRALEQNQIVITGAQGSTIVDHDGTTYLDA